jgi:hypothetical protein
VLVQLGWARIPVKGEQPGASVWRLKGLPRHEQPRHNPKRGKKPERSEPHDSPFAQLKVLMNAD